jgi:hypothetical protein
MLIEWSTCKLGFHKYGEILAQKDCWRCLNIYWDLVGLTQQELEQQRDYVKPTVDVGVHGDIVRQIAYFPDNETLVSCSQDPSATLVIRHVAATRTPYIFKLARVSIIWVLSRSSWFEPQLVPFNLYCSFSLFLFEYSGIVPKQMVMISPRPHSPQMFCKYMLNKRN